MKVKKFKVMVKAMAAAQAVIAPTLIVIGAKLNKPTLKNVGIIWCALITLDTARTTANAIDYAFKAENFNEDDSI